MTGADGQTSAQPDRNPPHDGLLSRVGLPALLTVLVFAAFWPGLQAYFVIIDDADYVFANAVTLSGLNANSVRWAFESTTVANNWQPITWLSHMLDVQLFGQEAYGHHLTSIVIHSVNAVLLFAILRGATGALWPSFLAAALFAVHPLRVESVVWVSERKDVLSTLFGLLSIAAYFRYVKAPSVRRYAFVGLFLALGLMTKPTLVTLPIVFMLLDYWPLRRGVWADDATFDWRAASRLCLEKLPLLGLSTASAVITIISQGNALVVGGDVPLAARLTNAAVSYAIYVGKALWPVGLSPFYAHPNLPGGVPWSSLEISASVVTLVVITLFVLYRRSNRYLLLGWFWYLVTLLPMIGLIQAGLQARADRYTYVPSIGLSIAAAFFAAHLVSPWLQSRAKQTVAAVATAAVLVASSAATFVQSQYWENSTTMLRRALIYAPNSPFLHANVGYYLAWSDQLDQAMKHLNLALRIDPGFYFAHTTAAAFLGRAGRFDESIAHYEAILETRPNDPAATKELFGVRMLKAQAAGGNETFP